MRNKIGVYQLFGENIKAKRLFYDWCKNCEELCEYDVEQIENDLVLPCIGNTEKYIYFSSGNILDWLEKIVQEYLIPYFENWIREDEKEEDVIKKTIDESSFYFENIGYGEELFIKI